MLWDGNYQMGSTNKKIKKMTILLECFKQAFSTAYKQVEPPSLISLRRVLLETVGPSSIAYEHAKIISCDDDLS